MMPGERTYEMEWELGNRVSNAAQGLFVTFLWYATIRQDSREFLLLPGHVTSNSPTKDSTLHVSDRRTHFDTHAFV